MGTGEQEILISLTKTILSELQLLTSSLKATALARFQRDILSSPQRQNVYMLINGENDSQKIAAEAGCGLRTVQSFIKELQEKDLIDFSKQGKSIIPQKSISKIATYYAKIDLENGGGQMNE